MSDLSGPPSPSDTDTSSGSQSDEGRVEPMGLTDFIGALTQEPKAEKTSAKRDRSGSMMNDNEAFGKEKMLSKLLDRDFDYQKYLHAEDFEPRNMASSAQGTATAQISNSGQGENTAEMTVSREDN